MILQKKESTFYHTQNTQFCCSITHESWYKSVSSQRPNTHFDYKEVCREIYKQTKEPNFFEFILVI